MPIASLLLYVILLDVLVASHTASNTIERGAWSLGLVGDPADVIRPTSGGTILVSGISDVDEAMKWMIDKSGGGDFVVLTAAGDDAYNSYFYDLGSVNSVETLLIDSRSVANDPQVEAIIRGAEAIYISGGDQANYVNYWKDTLVEDAINYLRNTKKIPVGGRSAGCAILGSTYFGALHDTITSPEALANPYDRRVTLGHNDFLHQPYLSNVITDTHFTNRDRHGRLVTFLARMSQDNNVVPRGIGLDESTALCIESNGTGKVFGYGNAFFFNQNGPLNTPELCASGFSLEWYRDQKAVRVYEIPGSTTGSGTFDLTTWSTQNGSRYFYYVDHGILGISQ